MKLLEREVKLAAPDTFSLARLARDFTPYVAAAVDLERLHTTYYDTEDYRLTRWGCSLRFRLHEGWTLKLPVPHESTELFREEHVFEGPATAPPAGALRLATAYLRGRVPTAVAELRTLRTKRCVLSQTGESVAEMVEDDVRVIESGRVIKRFRQIEIELAESAPDALLEELAGMLRREGAGRPDPVPKNVRALGKSAREPEVRAPDITARSSAGDLLRASLAAPVERLVRFDAKLRLNADAESVHQARVAVRRIRSHLLTFASILETHWVAGLRERLGWFADGLSDARDADVLLERLERQTDLLPIADRVHAGEALAGLRAQRTTAYRRLAELLRQDSYAALIDDTIAAAVQPLFTERAHCDATDVVPALMQDAWHALKAKVADRSGFVHDRELHRIRIKAKRVRYAAEAVAPVAGAAALRFARKVERLQTILGDHHDAVLAAERMRSAQVDARGAFVAGQLAMLEHRAALEMREAWQPAWREAARKKERFWR